MDPLTGQILAMVSEPPGKSSGERILAHPPGSLMTPFIYLTAFTRGFSPASLVWDIPLDDPVVSFEVSDPYKGPLRLRNALANDYWVPAIKVLQQIGLANVRQTASQLGLTSFAVDIRNQNTGDCLECEFVRNGDKITLIEAMQAYSVFANQGFLVGQPSGEITPYGFEPLQVTTVLNIQKTPTPLGSTPPDVQTRPVISSQLTYLVNHVLSDETARWSSLGHPNPLEIGRPAAVKMGRTDQGEDVWTIGYTPQLVVGVWMGVPPQNEKIEVPPKVASTLWHAVIQYATQDLPVSDWPIPEGMTTMDVCDPSGMLPTLQCPTVVSEIFINGQEPTQPDNLYRTYSINKETGRLATVFTPPELIEENIFLNVPPVAVDWAESVGLETPPVTYDVIYTPSMSPDAQIEYPIMFSTLHGEVAIKGSARGNDFVSYRLQAGEGLNPDGWTVVEEDRSTPVFNGILGTWDTSELEGLYALQLIVLRDNQQVDTTTIQVTLDNQPPNVAISYPSEGQTFSTATDKTITFLVNASDNMGVTEINYTLDGRLITTQTQTPYAYPWQVSAGKHTLTVEAIDRAGNSAEASLSFNVDE
jgi:membrane carboxypeptidase/penicillin-binding protein PbpC